MPMEPPLRDFNWESAGCNRYTAPVFRGDIRDCLRERPLVAGEVLGGVLPLAVREVGRLLDDASTVLAGALTVRVRIVYTHHHRVRGLARPRRSAVVADITENHRAIANAQLRAVVLAYLHTLDNPERRAQPVNRRAHVRIDQDGDHGRFWDGAVGLHCGHPISTNPL